MLNNEKIIWDFLKSKGFNDYVIAGIMGNFKSESNLNPMNLQNSFNKLFKVTDEQYTSDIDNGIRYFIDGAGYGLAQWTYKTRKQNLQKFAKNQGKSIGDLDMQLDFFFNELITNYKGLYNQLIKCKSVREASDLILTQYEKPADQSENVKIKRSNYGQEYYDKFHNNEEVNTTMSNCNGLKVLLDPGHYGYKYNQSPVYPDYYESVFTWKLANYLKTELEKYGVIVSLTRNNIEDNPDLFDRGYMSKGYDVFISLHSNACSNIKVDKVICFRGYDKVQSEEFAEELVKLITSIMGNNDIPVVDTKMNSSNTDEYYGVLRGARAAGLDYYYIIEHGFHTNLENSQFLYKDENIKKLATEEAKLIVSYFSKNIPTKNENIDTLNQYYVVKKGDTLSKIAKNHKTTYLELAKINGIKSPYTIYVGQKILIKKENKKADKATYIVQENDTLSKISQKVELSIDDLVQLNGLIKVGQELRIR